VTKLIQEKLDKLEYLKKAENWDNSQVLRLVNEIETLESLFENYNLGMNYFRRARGGRSGLRE
jgi:colicin import membrane protein